MPPLRTLQSCSVHRDPSILSKSLESFRCGSSEMTPWKVLKSRISCEDSWLKVRSDTVELADGTILAPYHVVEAPDWVKVIAQTKHDTIVLIEHHRHPVTARRELLEETGYGNGRRFGLGTLNAAAGRFTSKIHTFLAVGVEKTAVMVASDPISKRAAAQEGFVP